MKEQNKSLFMILSILMTLLIWMNSVLPAAVSSVQSGFITGLIQGFLSWVAIEIELEILSFYVRKFAHFGQFYVLGLFYFKTLTYYFKPISKIAIYTIGLGLIIAVIDESIQLFSEGRAFMLMDIAIDLFGVLMSVLCMIFLYHSQFKKTKEIESNA